MSPEKLLEEKQTLLKFIKIYCDDKHQKLQNDDLCKECQQLFLYACNRLEQCPHTIKPRCRKCQKPCYDKKSWKAVAKIMKYSGIKLGLIKVKNLLMNSNKDML